MTHHGVDRPETSGDDAGDRRPSATTDRAAVADLIRGADDAAVHEAFARQIRRAVAGADPETDDRVVAAVTVHPGEWGGTADRRPRDGRPAAAALGRVVEVVRTRPVDATPTTDVDDAARTAALRLAHRHGADAGVVLPADLRAATTAEVAARVAAAVNPTGDE